MTSTRQLLSGAAVLTQDSALGNFASADVLIVDGRIADVAPYIDADNAVRVDLVGTVLLPGLVNAHQHLWQTALRGLAPNMLLKAYFAAIQRDLGPHFDAETSYHAIFQGARDSIGLGVTTVFDWHHNILTPEHGIRGYEALIDSGIRAVYGYGLSFGRTEHDPADIKRLAEESPESSRIAVALAIAGPATSDMEVVARDIGLARDLGLRWSLHTGARGIDPVTPNGVSEMDARGLLGPDGDFVHANTYSDGELATLLARGATITVAPEIELQMGHGNPVTERLWALAGRPALGGDTACLVPPDMLAIARATLFDGRGRATTESLETGRQILYDITQGNADRIGLGHDIDSISVGKKADLVAFDAPQLAGLSPEQIEECFVSQVSGYNARDIWIDGAHRDCQSLRRTVGSEFTYARTRLAEISRALG